MQSNLDKITASPLHQCEIGWGNTELYLRFASFSAAYSMARNFFAAGEHASMLHVAFRFSHRLVAVDWFVMEGVIGSRLVSANRDGGAVRPVCMRLAGSTAGLFRRPVKIR